MKFNFGGDKSMSKVLCWGYEDCIKISCSKLLSEQRNNEGSEETNDTIYNSKQKMGQENEGAGGKGRRQEESKRRQRLGLTTITENAC